MAHLDLRDTVGERVAERAILNAWADWADDAFPDETMLGVARHLLSEVEELLLSPESGDEHADVFALAHRIVDDVRVSAAQHGIDLLAELQAKLDKNRARMWADRGDGVYEHVRPLEAVAAPVAATYDPMLKSADFGEGRLYRYRLLRRWADGTLLNVIGLNPSTADEAEDDPTIRRCIGFARAWGHGGLVMTNLFACRSTDPSHLLACEDPIGPMNDAWLRQEALASGMVLAAWGAHKAAYPRAHDVTERVLKGARRLDGSPLVLYCLKRTANGYPQHPLYIRADTRPSVYARVE